MIRYILGALRQLAIPVLAALLLPPAGTLAYEGNAPHAPETLQDAAPWAAPGMYTAEQAWSAALSPGEMMFAAEASMVAAEEPLPALPDFDILAPPPSGQPAGGAGGLNFYGDLPDRYQRLSWGGYGEIHANWVEGPGRDEVDLHRIIFSPQYDFTSWLRFFAELEIEHALMTKTSGGEILIEQAFVEYEVREWLRLRAGRILVPLGIVNQRHEPPAFNGVERPSFNRVIIPSTWFAEGIGARGILCPALTFELYLMTGLDGSRFNAMNGIRGGRIGERSSMQQPAVTGRLDWFPFAVKPAPGQQFLRFGTSAFYGGVNNGNAGVNPGRQGDVGVISADFEYRLWRADFRGEFAFEDIADAANLGAGTAQEIVGWYLETALHVLPDCWKCGRLQQADAVVFVRFDDLNTQYRMPPGVARNDAGVRHEWTFGLGYLPVPNLVVKADYQISDDATAAELPDRFNLGVGWQY